MRSLLFFALLFCAGLAQAQSTYRWVDEKGKVHYGDRPPAAKGNVQERKHLVGAEGVETMSPEMRQAVAAYPVTLYTSSECGEPCKQGAAHLKKRGIPFTEKAVTSNEDSAALAKLIGGDLVVPVLQVGAKARKGFASQSWDDLLDISGYPKP